MLTCRVGMFLQEAIVVDRPAERIIAESCPIGWDFVAPTPPSNLKTNLAISPCPIFTSKPLAEFRALAAQLAVNKARSLGWIVEARPGA